VVDHTRTPPPGPIEPAPLEPPSEDPEERRRDGIRIVGLVLVVIAAVLIMLLFRGCSEYGGGTAGLRRSIESVEGSSPSPGFVSVWVKQGESIDAVLNGAGIMSDDITDLGEGRYVIAVAPGSESGSVRTLKADSRTHDAGLVYEGEPLSREPVEADTRP
jgi:ABC-type cobalt transport system substrate-binding protein